jgi:beta-lactamase regulating signal transducer with metallopeptidase domain/protocatechuate 3,4-dioxygenase beta subunit
MGALSETAALWLVDFHVLALALLATALVVLAPLKQPARRMPIAKATLAALAALALLCALPGWSFVHLRSAPSESGFDGAVAVPAERPVTQFIPHINVGQTSAPEATPAPTIAPRRPNVMQGELTVARLTTWALIIHAIGSSAVIAWLVGGAVLARRIVRRAVTAPAEWGEALARPASRGAAPNLFISADINTPVAIGVWRARILLPSPRPRDGSACREERELSTVLAHEWAHIRNGDLRTLAASRWLLVLLWPQPLFWRLRRLVRLDQETLADAEAAEASGRVAYAEQLLDWARASNLGDKPHGSLRAPRLAGAVGLWEGRMQLKRRVAILLNERFAVMRSCSRRWRFACLVATSLSALALSLVTLQPATQAEENQAAAAQANADEPNPKQQTQHTAIGAARLVAVPTDQNNRPVQYKKNGLKVTVVDPAGKPLPGVEVLIYRASFKKQTHHLAHKARTDEQGVATFDNLLPADVVASYDEAAKENNYPFSLDDSVLIGLRKPGLTTMLIYDWGYPLAVRGSERMLMMRPAAELRGRVTDPRGNPIAGATVVAGRFPSMAIEGINTVTTDADGRYAFADRVAFNAKEAREKQRGQLTFWKPSEALAAKKDADKPEDPADDSSVSNLMVTHPDFAATQVEGGDVPGVTDVTMQLPATIEGRVVWHDSGKPASGVAVQATGQLTSAGPTESADFGSTPDFHAATTTTDNQGRYRLANLPPGTYSVWADPQTQVFSDAEWISQGHGGLEARAGAPVESPELVIGPGGIIRGQLVDAKTGEPLKLSEPATAQPFMELVEGPKMQPTLIQRVPVTADGKFEMRTPPGKLRAGVFVNHGRQSGQHSMLYQSDDDILQDGEIFDLEHRETIDAKFPVWPVAELNAWREQVQQAHRLNSEGKTAEAIQAFTAMHNDRPDDHAIVFSRGTARMAAGQYKEAISDFERSLALQPGNLHARLWLADLLATAPNDTVRDGTRALYLAKQLVADATKMGSGNAELLAAAQSRLAAAHAEVGDFEKAVVALDEALKTTPKERHQPLKQRLDLYKRGKPFRREPPPTTANPKTSEIRSAIGP